MQLMLVQVLKSVLFSMLTIVYKLKPTLFYLLLLSTVNVLLVVFV